jgi:type II secretory pathway component PulC
VFLARAAASAVESSIVIPPPKAAARTFRQQTPTVYTKEIEPILNRNVFCSTCPPILAKPDETPSGPEAPQPPQKTTLPLALLAIMYAPPPHGSEWSVAIVRDTEDKSMGAFGVGSKVHNATIKEIQETRVYIENSGRTEFLDLLDGSNQYANTAPPPQATPTPAQPQGDALSRRWTRASRSSASTRTRSSGRRWSPCSAT